MDKSNNGFGSAMELALTVSAVQLAIYKDKQKNPGKLVNIMTWLLFGALGYMLYQKIKPIWQARSIDGFTEGLQVKENPVILGLNPGHSTKSSMLGITLSVKDEPKRLPYGQPVYGELKLNTPSTNSGDIYIADSPVSCSTGPRWVIPAGSSETIRVSEISSLYYHGTLGDELSLYAEIKALVLI